jgi:adenylate cyclase
METSRATLCKGCWSRFRMPIPIRGPMALPFKLVGVKASRMSPNLCTLCETMFQLLMKTKRIQISATVLFADVRGYTGLSEQLDSPDVADLLDEFYELCSTPVWNRDGIVNKLIGDAVFAIFNFPVSRDDHARMAVMSALEMQARCSELTKAATESGQERNDFRVGIGIHTGDVTIGEIGQFCKDFTAVGDVVNIAARLQGAAQPGEVLVSDAVMAHVPDLLPQAVSKTYTLKGISRPVQAYALSPTRPMDLASDPSISTPVESQSLN